MKLFHYTSIETLALILKNKTIRFTRLDRVDDPDEYSFKEDGITPAHYCFVSCWTKNSKENLPQWYMYGNSTHGVRIELDSDMFAIEDKKLNPKFFNNTFMRTKQFMIMPILSEGFLRDIHYIDDVKKLKEKIFHQFSKQHAIDFKELGFYKSTDWAFQQECRFLFYVMPLLPNGLVNIDYVFQNNIKPKASYIDVPIKEEWLKQIRILLGPKVSEAEEIIVKSLMKDFLNRTDYEYSFYKDKL